MTATTPPTAALEQLDCIDSQDFPNSRPDHTPDPGSVLHLRVNGPLHAANRNPLKHRLLDELDAGRKAIVLDLTVCGYLDASAQGMLVSIEKHAQRCGARLVLVGLSEDVRMLFALTQLDTLFTIADSLLLALADLEGEQR